MSAKAAIPADRVAFIQTIRAQVGQLWRLLQANLGAEEHPALTKGLQSINDGYFGKFQPLADTMRKASAEGAKYPMPLPDWVKASTPLLATTGRWVAEPSWPPPRTAARRAAAARPPRPKSARRRRR